MYGQGAALYFVLTNTADIHNCLFVDNLSDGDQCAYIGSGENEVVFRNCTILGTAENRHAVYWYDRGNAPSLVNCIIHKPYLAQFPSSWTNPIAGVTYSNVHGGYPGEGNIDADPMFVDPGNGDFRLMRGSPCIDSGTDTGLLTDLDGNPRPIGLYDMGAYEFPFLRSDINGDGVVDALDLLIFSEDWRRVSAP